MLKFLLYLLTDISGKDGGDTPEPPTFKEDPATTALKGAVTSKTNSLLDIPYEDLVKRYSSSPETNQLFTDVIGKYKGLMDTQDYSTTDNSKIEQDYLDSVLNKYNQARDKSFKPIQESLIAENLYGSGPGYGIMKDYAKETSQGVGDIAKQWAYEGIQRKQNQQQYMDALKRGDYSTMYNLALSESNREIAPQTAATNTEATYLNAANGLFGSLSAEDTAKYQAEMQKYEAQVRAAAANKKNLGGAGSMIGLGLGALLAAPTGGMSLMMGAGLGSSIGGGVGSMIEY